MVMKDVFLYTFNTIPKNTSQYTLLKNTLKFMQFLAPYENPIYFTRDQLVEHYTNVHFISILPKTIQ